MGEHMHAFSGTQLFVLPTALTLPQQIEVVSAQVGSELRNVFGSADFEVVNGDPIEGSIVALPIERVRELHVEVIQSPLLHPMRIFFIANIELASIPAQNALLKLLEEPPRHVKFLLTTNKLGAVLETIQSRCQMIELYDQTGEIPQNVPEHLVEVITAFPAQKFSINEVFALSEQYKDRADALEVMRQLLLILHEKIQAHPTPKLVQSVQALTTAIDQLEKNVNCRLVLEAYFFQFIDRRHP
jgi:DNA polymerase III delta prime subunit